METNTGLFIAVLTVFSCGWAQAQPQAPAELQPGYPGYPASGVTTAPVQDPVLPEAAPGPGWSAGSSGSPAPDYQPVPGQSLGDPGLNVPPVEVHRFPGATGKPLSPPAPMTRVEPITENGITYLCGGIGLDEADQIKQEARNYDLILTFAARNGSYLADVNVDIADALGKSLLKTTCGAPMMLVNLPKNGNYQIRAETGGQTLVRAVQVREAQRGKTVTMTWPAKSNDMGGP
jgi:hypothetical protein